MKKLLFFIFISIFFVETNAQYSRASLWTADMKAFESEDALNGIPQNVVLFAGSSSFRMWTSVKTDFPKSNVLNRAFGGSWMSDLIYYFNQIVVPYNPAQVVLYEGDNDLYDPNKSVDEYFDDVVTMTRMINIYFPNCKILYVSVKPSPSRTVCFDKYKAANTLMKAYADKLSYVEFADVWTPMLNQDGTPNASLFGSDMLHMNASGYALWKSILEPLLLEGTAPVISNDKVIFTESSNAAYHDYSWVNVSAPSVFNTNKSEKISCDSTHHFEGSTSLKLSYQGLSGGNWKACVAADSWTAYDVSNDYNLIFQVNSNNNISAVDLPDLYLESFTGATTERIHMSDYISSIPANSWTEVNIPVEDWKKLSADFTYDNVKTIFFAQHNLNSQQIEFFVDDIKYILQDTIPAVSDGSDIFIDFGSNLYITNGNYNDVIDTQSANLLLKDIHGAQTGITLKITDPFYVGYNTNGPTATTDDASIFAATAVQDNFFGHGIDWGTTPANPTAEIEFSGLDPQKKYSFTFFASRMGVTDNREALYTITGNNSSTYSTSLDAANNSSKTATIIDVVADSDSIVKLKIEAGPNNSNSTKFFYLGAIKIVTTQIENGVNQVGVNKFPVYYLNNTLHFGDFNGDISLFDTTGKVLAQGNVSDGKYGIKLEKGVYLVKSDFNTGKFVVD